MPDQKDRDKAEVIQGEFTEKPGGEAIPMAPPERGVVVRTPSPQDLAQWSPQFEKAAVDRAVVQVKEKRRFFDEVMTSGSHYAIIPGQKPTKRIDQATGEQAKDAKGNLLTDPPKPALLKPGAELLLSAMALHPELVDEIVDEDWIGEKHGGEAFFRYRRRCNVWRQTGPGPEDRMLIASASGECHSWEEKYRFRGQGGRACPECGMVGTVRKGSAQYAPREHGRTGPVLAGFEGGGFYCWKKIDGCGSIFADKDARITDQELTKEKHPNPADLTNTLLKMADKRALVAATLLATGCSDLFTQDIEEKGEAAAATPTAPEAPAPPVDTRMPENEQKLIRDAYASFQKTRADKKMNATAQEMAGVVINNFSELMEKHGFGKWQSLWDRGGPFAAEFLEVLGLTPAPAPEEPAHFDPDEVVAAMPPEKVPA